MERNLRWTALVLKTNRIGDIHRGVTLLSRRQGLVSAIAHGAHSERGRLKGVTDPFCTGVFYLYHDPVKDSYKIIDVDVRSFNNGLREGLERYYAASLMTEIVLRSHGGEAAPLYDLVDESFSALAAASAERVRYDLVVFLWRFLELSGLRPSLVCCSECGSALASDRALASDWTGFVCPACAHPDSPLLSPGAVRYLARIETLSLEQALAVSLDAQALFGLKSSLLRLMEATLGARLTVPEACGGLI